MLAAVSAWEGATGNLRLATDERTGCAPCVLR